MPASLPVPVPDHYPYPGTEVLVNKFGIADPAEWKAVETAAIGQRMTELLLTPIVGGFDFTHLRAVHAHLVQDLYSRGGEPRDTDTAPGQTALIHCRPEFIDAEAERIFTALAAADFLRGHDADGFASGLSWAWGEATACTRSAT